MGDSRISGLSSSRPRLADEDEPSADRRSSTPTKTSSDAVGARRMDAWVLSDAPTVPAAAASRDSRSEKSPWNVDYENIRAEVHRYDQTLFTNPALVVRVRDSAAPTQSRATQASQASQASQANQADADAAWDTVAKAPMPAIRPIQPCAPSSTLATVDNAKLLADRGVPLGVALQHTLLATIPELERFIDEYVAYTGSRPEMKALHEQALRTGPEIFAKRLDTEAAEQKKVADEQQMHDRMALMQVRPPLPMQQRAAVGEVAIPIAHAVDEVAKFVPVVGELVLAVEVITGKTLGGLGYDISASERIVSGALLLAPFAVGALAGGVRGAAQVVRLARATGRTTQETRQLLTAVRTIEANKVLLREGLAAKRAGVALTPAQAEAFRAADGALIQLRGAAAKSIFDLRSGAPVRSFAQNANGATRSLDEARAIAERHGVTMPSWIKIVIDPTVREAKNYAVYNLTKDEVKETSLMTWKDLSRDGTVEVRIHPSVFQSDEKIVGVFQHEAWELSQLKARVEAKGMLPADTIEKLTDGTGRTNLHGQAWDIADQRVLIMRERDPVRRAAHVKRLELLINKYEKENLR